MASACMVCGGKPTTLEHIFPDWLKTYLPPIPGSVGVAGPKGLKWILPSFDQMAKLVCESCNGGWMSTLESLVSPMIGPTIRSPSAPLSLSVDDQRILAKWAVKTALVIQAAIMRGKKGSYVPTDHLRWFEENKDNREAYDPPPATRVWMFLRRPITSQGQSSLAYAFTFSAASGPPMPGAAPSHHPNAYITTFSVGYLGFQVVGQDRPVDGKPSLEINTAERAGVLTGILIPIWPTIGSRNPWPPRIIVGPDDLDVLSTWGLDPRQSQ